MNNFRANSRFILIWGAAAVLALAAFILTAGFPAPPKTTPADFINPPATVGENNTEEGGSAGKSRLPESEDAAVKLVFFGDLMIDRHVRERIERFGFDHLFARLATGTDGIRLADYDLAAANLEGAVTDGGRHYPPDNLYDFAFLPGHVARLKDYGFNFFNLANNHLADQGERGIIETRTNLDALGFEYVGCKDGVTGDCSLKKLEVRNKKLGMAGFSMVYRLIPAGEMTGIVAELASTTDFVVVNMHWGVEYEHKFRRAEQELAHRLIEAGADIIIGHHPHVVQGLEIYRGRPIFYSLGNFIFDQYFSAATQTGLAVGFSFNGADMEIELFPFKSVASQVELMAGAEKEKLFNDFAGWSVLDDDYRIQLLQGNIVIKDFY